MIYIKNIFDGLRSQINGIRNKIYPVLCNHLTPKIKNNEKTLECEW